MSLDTISINEINRLRHESYGNNKEAQEMVEKLIEQIVVSDSNDFMMAQYALISGYFWGAGMTEEGKYYIAKALEFSEYASDKISLIDVYIQAGNYASLQESYGEPLSWYYKALDISESIDYNGEIARIYNNIGTLFINCNNTEKGLEYLLISEKFSKRYTDGVILSVLYNNLAETYLAIGNLSKASYYIDLMEGHLRQFGSDIQQLNHMINRWKYALKLGDASQAEIIYLQAQKLLDKIPFGNDHIMNNLEVFDVLVEMDKYDIAVKNLEDDIHKLESNKDYNNLKKVYQKLIQYYDASNDNERKMNYIIKNYENDLLLQEAQITTMNRALEHIDASRKSTIEAQMKSKTAYSALTTENTRLLAVNNNLRAIHDIGVKILSTTDLVEIHDILLKKVNDLYQVEEFAIGIIKDDNETLLFKYSSKLSHAELRTQEVSLKTPKSLSVKCFLSNEEIIINDCEKELPERYERNLKRGEKLSSLVFIPIIVEDKPFGVMTVQHTQKNAFSSLQLEVFRLLATFASVSFMNAQHNFVLTEEIDKRSSIQNELEVINDQLNHLAKHDDLTGVYNRRTLEKVYHTAFEESRKLARSLTVMILDIDYFKEYNDQYGHMQGDACIIQVANTLKSVLKRQQDFIARYGGDEFMILLPDTDREGAEVVASNLVKAIRNLKIQHVGSPIDEFVTISLGLVSKIIDAKDDSDDLLILADKALYKVKKNWDVMLIM